MEVELKSEWQDTRVELLKSLHGYEMEGVNRELGCVDYVAQEGGDEKKLLRVVVDPHFRGSKADLETVRKTLKEVEEGECDEAIIVAERFTSAAKRIVEREEGLGYASQEEEGAYSVTELMYAIQDQIRGLCESRCGGLPSSEEECGGYADGRYTCPVRRISDDSDFHAEHRWLPLLMSDFSKLVGLRRET